jgi:hypothetical protein
MNRWGLGLALALVFSRGVVAGDLSSSAQTAKTQVNARCAALGAGFLPVGGSDACVRISGHISAGVGFAAGAARGDSSGLNFDPGPPNGLGAQAAAGDWRFDTPSGPGRVDLEVGSSANSRWAVDGQ